MVEDQEEYYDYDSEYYKYDDDEKTQDSVCKDSNGNVLQDGDSVTLTQDLKVKGTSVNLKRGTLIKNIRITDNPEEIEAVSEHLIDMLSGTYKVDGIVAAMTCSLGIVEIKSGASVVDTIRGAH